MTTRGKKLRGNGIWEASRMMLPEHKSAIRTHRTQLGERRRPELDEQRIEELSRALAEALESGRPAGITTFGAYGDVLTTGIVVKIDPIERYVKLAAAEETVWIPFGDIVQVSSGGP